MTYSQIIRTGALVSALIIPLAVSPAAQQSAPVGKAPAHAKGVRRLLIRNTMVVYGNARPAFGPVDILVEDGLIMRVAPHVEVNADAIIDGTGKYVLPGFVNTHGHLQDERAGIPQPVQYELNLYLAAGVTTFRDVGSDFDKAKRWRAQSAAHELIAPRIQLYSMIWRSRGMTPPQIREGVRYAKDQGSDGLKLSGLDRDQLEAVMDEAHKLELPTATHIGVEETTAKDYAELGVSSIEHFYGVADAALDGIQDFPADMNYSNEIDRFGQAGELYLQHNLDRGKLSSVLDLMVAHEVAWSPTFSIYMASRDLVRAQNLPWFKDYLHPAVEEFFKPSLTNHGSYFIAWTNSHEVRWKKNYQVWMDAVREFSRKGGLVTTGDDAGFIYSLYGFGLSEELALQEEAGFHPLEVIRNATVNGAKLLGLDDRIGRVREGYIADLLVVNGNPLENLRILNPYGTDINVNNRSVRGGGIEWTIKDGIPYHVPTLLREVKDIVAKGRVDRSKWSTFQP